VRYSLHLLNHTVPAGRVPAHVFWIRYFAAAWISRSLTGTCRQVVGSRNP
jgi:hypothetical protein